MENPNIQDLFYNHYRNLDEDAIFRLNNNCNSGELNNVVVGLEKHCFGLLLNDDEDEINYQIFYVRGDRKLEGDLIQLKANLKYRDELVFYFSYFLSHNYDDIDAINTFNTFQKQTRGMLEKSGYLTVASTFIDKYDDISKTIIAKNVKGIIPVKLINRSDFYKDLLGIKELPIEQPDNQYVYLMLNKRNNYIKIGKSIRPAFREKTLQADEPDIEVITFWKAPSTLERQLHKQFALKRQRGEWFKLNLKDLMQIKKIMDDYKVKGSS